MHTLYLYQSLLQQVTQPDQRMTGQFKAYVERLYKCNRIIHFEKPF